VNPPRSFAFRTNGRAAVASVLVDIPVATAWRLGVGGHGWSVGLLVASLAVLPAAMAANGGWLRVPLSRCTWFVVGPAVLGPLAALSRLGPMTAGSVEAERALRSAVFAAGIQSLEASLVAVIACWCIARGVRRWVGAQPNSDRHE
jgi:hypothetical protein